MNQGLHFPLADYLTRLDAAELTLREVMWRFDYGSGVRTRGPHSQVLCADFGFKAADRALRTHGGIG